MHVFGSGVDNPPADSGTPGLLLVDMFHISALVSNTLSSRGDPLTALKTCGARLVATHQPEHF